MLTPEYYEKNKDIIITPKNKNEIIKSLKYDNTLLSNTIVYQDKKIFSLEQILNKIEQYCDNSDELYEYVSDDEETALKCNYKPSNFKKNIISIIKGCINDE